MVGGAIIDCWRSYDIMDKPDINAYSNMYIYIYMICICICKQSFRFCVFSNRSGTEKELGILDSVSKSWLAGRLLNKMDRSNHVKRSTL